MGAAIAYTLATAGISVTVVERSASSAEWASKNLQKLIDQGISRGILSVDAAKTVEDRLVTVSGYDALPPTDLAIEAAFEDFAVKTAILTELEGALPPETIIATNTSYLDVNRLSDGLKHPARFVGMHFFSPAHIMKLLEVVRSDRTSDGTLGAALVLAHRLGKIPVLSGVCDGFIGNRILSSYRRAANRLLVEGLMSTRSTRLCADSVWRWVHMLHRTCRGWTSPTRISVARQLPKGTAVVTCPWSSGWSKSTNA